MDDTHVKPILPKAERVVLVAFMLMAVVLVTAMVLLGVAVSVSEAGSQPWLIDQCTDCHQLPPTDATGGQRGNPAGAVAGSHGVHSGLACSVCHAAPAPTDYAHSDGTINIASPINAPITGGGYSRGSIPQSSSVTPAQLGDCSNVYCHSIVQTGTTGGSLTAGTSDYAAPKWGNTSVVCGDCHKADGVQGNATTMDSGSHTKHLAPAAGAVCDDCHSSGTHVNGSVDVDAGVSYNGTPVPGDGYNSCSTAWCHENGRGGYSVIPAWGTLSTGCDFCHGNPPATGAHVSHTTGSSAYGGTGVLYDANGWVDADCGNCHPVSASSHRDGSVQTSLSNAEGQAGDLKLLNGPSAGFAGGACSEVYCHSDGYDPTGTGAYGYTPSPDWSTGQISGLCSDCHGNSPATNAHSTHTVGIHWEDIYNGTSGLLTTGGTGPSSHGDGVSTTISCNICHNDTVDQPENAGNDLCVTCHDGNALVPLGGDYFASLRPASSTHLNGQVDVVFVPETIKSRAQLRDPGLTGLWTRNTYKAGDGTSVDTSSAALNTATDYDDSGASPNCTVACHNDIPVVWNDTGVNCFSCHDQLPQ